MTSQRGGVNSEPESYSLNLTRAAGLSCTSNDYALGQNESWYQKLVDFENASDEQNNMSHPAYMKFKSQAPQKTDRDEAVSTDEFNYVMNYLKEHPNEGSTEFEHYNYYIQLVGKVHKTYGPIYDNNNAPHTMDGSGQMDYFEVKDQNGEWKHMNDYNGDAGNRTLVLNCKITEARYHDSYGNNTYNYYKFYTIEYNGKKNLYLCFDYATEKKDDGEKLSPDGTYNDWVIKIIPGCSTSGDQQQGGGDQQQGGGDQQQGGGDQQQGGGDQQQGDNTPSVTLKGEVEVNFSVQDHKDENSSKLSIHVRDTCNFKVFIPVPVESYCQADDMYIVEKHYDKMSYNEKTSTLTREINGQEVTLTVTYAAEGIYVESAGINAKVLEYLRNVYGDGITFEVYNYYNTALTREKLIEYLNKATIEFTDNQPKSYINTIKDTNVDADNRKLDCVVTKK